MKSKLAICLVLIAATLAVFWQVGHNDFINFDDPGYVYENPHVASGVSLENIRWAFTAMYMSNWHPLTWLSHMLDCQLFGLNPGGHHVTNLVLHILTTVLLFLFLNLTTGTLWRSAFVAALFALHPLHVESVAWVAERKDVLSALFWALTLLTYSWYVKRPGWRRYVPVVMIFALGLMAKPMLVTLPFALLLLDYWPLGRFSPHLSDDAGEAEKNVGLLPARLVLEKVPLLALAIASSAISYLAQKKAGSITEESSFVVNVGNALLSYLAYMGKMVWPGSLSIYYIFDPARISLWNGLAAGLFLAAVSVVVIRRRRDQPYLVTGWFWYLGTLVPVIGFVRLGQHAMADRYSYIPLIGLFIIIAWGGCAIAVKWRLRKEAIALAAVSVLVALSLATWRQVGYWSNSITLFTHAVNVTENNWLAHDNLSGAYVSQGNLVAALAEIDESLRINPNPSGYTHQGWIYAQLGDYPRSIESCRKAIMLAPAYGEAHFMLARDFIALKDYPAALAEYDLLRRIDAGLAYELREQLTSLGVVPPEDGAGR